MKSQSLYVKVAETGPASSMTRSQRSGQPGQLLGVEAARGTGAERRRDASTRAPARVIRPASVSTANWPRASEGQSPPLEQPVGLHPVDQARQSAAAEQHGVGEVSHAQRPPVGGLEVDHHVVLRQRQAVRRAQLGVELLHERRVGPQEAPPGPELVTGQPGGGRCAGRRCGHARMIAHATRCRRATAYRRRRGAGRGYGRRRRDQRPARHLRRLVDPEQLQDGRRDVGEDARRRGARDRER